MGKANIEELIQYNADIAYSDAWEAVFVDGLAGAVPSYNGDHTEAGGKAPGRWAWKAPDGQFNTGSYESTSGRMVLTAMGDAINTIDSNLIFVTDNPYVYSAITRGWWIDWTAREWMNDDGTPTDNADLWEPIISKYKETEVEFVWTLDHPSNIYQEILPKWSEAQQISGVKQLVQSAP